MKFLSSGLLLFLMIFFAFQCQATAQEMHDRKLQYAPVLIRKNPDAAFLQIKRVLKDAQKNGDQYTTAVCYTQIGELFYDQAAYSQALDNYYKADHLFRKGDYALELASNLNSIGETYYYNRQYDIALKSFQESLSLYKKLQDKSGMANSYGFIGQTYEKTKDYRQAFTYQQLALREFKKLKDQTGIAKIYENLGSIYEDKFQLDSALKYFRLSFDLNKNHGDKTAQIEIVNNIGDVYRKTGQYATSLVYARKAANMAKELDEPYQHASAYRDLSKTYELMGKHDSAYYYSEAGRGIFMRIFSEDNRKQLLLLQTLFEIEQKDNAITQLENDRQRNRLITIGALVIIILLISLGASIISRQRLKIKSEQQLNEQNINLYEAQKKDLELKSKELTTHTLHLIQKNQLLEELKSKLNSMVKDDKRDQRKELKQLITLINFSSNLDKNWDDFRIIFESVYEHFFDSLKKHADNLTAADFRLVALLKMNLNSADISTLLGISQDSLRISRYRLRKKLHLQEGEKLSTFIQNL
jgi:tetratricopeptide (TPR) repeat protein